MENGYQVEFDIFVAGAILVYAERPEEAMEKFHEMSSGDLICEGDLNPMAEPSNVGCRLLFPGNEDDGDT